MLCDTARLNQVILNLIVNAADALGKGPSQEIGHIRIHTKAHDGYVEIRIEDDGPGMPEEVRAKIFDPIFTTKPVGKGTGQGLAISHDVIANKHQGTIGCTSNPGEGTTFVICLPFGDQACASPIAS